MWYHVSPMKPALDQAAKFSNYDRLRKDVRFLTTLLGDVIREQEGKRLFDIIEEIFKAVETSLDRIGLTT